MVATTPGLPKAPSVEALRIVNEYCQGSPDGGRFVSRKLIRYQARRAQYVATTLAKPGVLVLNDPVGTGKTVIALTAARLLFGRGHINHVVIVAPEATVAGNWTDRVGYISSMTTSFTCSGRGAAVQVLTRHQLPPKPPPRLRRARDLVLLIIDEAHRGLQNPASPSDTKSFRAKVTQWAEGAHVLLVTATPFQLRPSGVERMLEIDGDDERGDLIKDFLNAQAAWLRAIHNRANPPYGSTPSSLDSRVDAEEQRVREALNDAAPSLERVLMPAFDRAAMKLPEEFDLPHPTWVPAADSWLRAYHVARLLPALLGLVDEDDAPVRNSDTYMRMLTSSRAAWHDTTAYEAAAKSTSPQITALLAELDRSMGSSELDHPKVAETARLAITEALHPREAHHVLIFCVFKETQNALHTAITQQLAKQGATARVRVERPGTAKEAKALADNSGFRRPARESDQVVVVIARDNLSESIDLDGGEPVVIHHDLAWSPVRWPQRLGRVVRASSGFSEPAGVIVPVLETDIDRRMWETLQGRKHLTAALVPNPRLRALLDEALLDWSDDQ